jgi:hypothetical protein
MAHLHIRDVDDGLLKALKLRALEDGTTLKGWVVNVLSTAVKPGWVFVEVETKLPKPRVQKESVVVPPHSPELREPNVEVAARAVVASRRQPVCEHQVNAGNWCWKCKGPAKEKA